MCISRITACMTVWQAASSPSRRPRAQSTWVTAAILRTIASFSSNCARGCAQLFVAVCLRGTRSDPARASLAGTGAAWVLSGHLCTLVWPVGRLAWLLWCCPLKYDSCTSGLATQHIPRRRTPVILVKRYEKGQSAQCASWRFDRVNFPLTHVVNYQLDLLQFENE